MKVRFTPEGRHRQAVVNLWWREHGDDPNLFDEELEAALEQLERFPLIGTRYRKLEDEDVQLYRVLLKKTQQWGSRPVPSSFQGRVDLRDGA